MSFKGPIEDRLAIQELNGEYAHAVHVLDGDVFARVWAPEAEWHHPWLAAPLVGHDAVVGLLGALQDGLATVHFMAMLAGLTVDGDRAEGTSYVLELIVRKDGEKLRMYGRYDDRYVKRDGQWRFACRRYTLVHQD